jgi:hypothetical protein
VGAGSSRGPGSDAAGEGRRPRGWHPARPVVPSRSKPLFPAERVQLAIVLRGMSLHEVRWDPRLGPDRERSGVLRIGKHAASRLTEGETLRITQIEGGVQLD